MFAAMAARGAPDMQPIVNNQPLWGFLFVIIAFFTSYVGLGMFLGTVFDTFNTVRESAGAVDTTAVSAIIRTVLVLQYSFLFALLYSFLFAL